jgi:hypothetical protein
MRARTPARGIRRAGLGLTEVALILRSAVA